MATIKWLGHATFEINMAGRIVFLDPWLDGNPKAPVKTSNIKDADIVCVTHDHADHMGSASEICRQTNAVFVGTPELCNYAKERGIKEAVGFNIGGTANVKGIDIIMTQAFHTSDHGAPTGFVLKGKEESIYHAGDTGLFGDMKCIGKLYRPNVALLPIGGFYTMHFKEATEAVKLINPEIVIPMHYQTFPVLAKTADDFVKMVNKRIPDVKAVVLAPGETYSL
ncbi:MAG: metal-dependent hydrolase [Candidatus Bathyarchaeia archaeon]